MFLYMFYTRNFRPIFNHCILYFKFVCTFRHFAYIIFYVFTLQGFVQPLSPRIFPSSLKLSAQHLCILYFIAMLCCILLYIQFYVQNCQYFNIRLYFNKCIMQPIFYKKKQKKTQILQTFISGDKAVGYRRLV
jgi:hypothetical protein